MKQFEFTLQPLYDMQENMEKQYKMQMSNIETEMGKRMGDLEILNANFDKMKNEYCTMVSQGVQASRISEYGRFFDRLKAVMGLVQDKIACLEKEKERCFQNLVQTRREKKLLDKLRENQYVEYLEACKKDQYKRVDDLISYRVSV